MVHFGFATIRTQKLFIINFHYNDLASFFLKKDFAEVVNLKLKPCKIQSNDDHYSLYIKIDNLV